MSPGEPSSRSQGPSVSFRLHKAPKCHRAVGRACWPVMGPPPPRAETASSCQGEKRGNTCKEGTRCCPGTRSRSKGQCGRSAVWCGDAACVCACDIFEDDVAEAPEVGVLCVTVMTPVMPPGLGPEPRQGRAPSRPQRPAARGRRGCRGGPGRPAPLENWVSQPGSSLTHRRRAHPGRAGGMPESRSVPGVVLTLPFTV